MSVLDNAEWKFSEKRLPCPYSPDCGITQILKQAILPHRSGMRVGTDRRMSEPEIVEEIHDAVCGKRLPNTARK